MASQSVAREIQELCRKLESLTNGQAKMFHWDTDDFRKFVVELTPNSGYYHNMSYQFEIYVPDMYPHYPPEVTCLSDIYRPNIDHPADDTNVCLNILESENWYPGYGLQGCVLGLLFLLHHPNFDDPYSPMFEPRLATTDYKQDIEQYAKGEYFGSMQGVIQEAIGAIGGLEDLSESA